MVVIIAMAIGLFGGVLTLGILNGWIEQRIRESIYNEISHGQLHNPEYLLNEETQHYIDNYEQIAALLDTLHAVKGYSGRVRIFTMAQSDRASTGLITLGVNPNDETTISGIPDKIITGTYLGKKYRIPTIILGSKAAETLKLVNYKITTQKLDSLSTLDYPEYLSDSLSVLVGKNFRSKSKFKKQLEKLLTATDFEEYQFDLIKYFSEYRLHTSVILTLQTVNGELHNQLFKVRGIYRTSNSRFDALNAFVDRSVLSRMAELTDNQVHQIAFICNDVDSTRYVTDLLAKTFPTISVRSWKQTSPEIALFADMGKFMGLIYIIIFLFALSFGIINTMMMSVLERTNELGMLMAIGMNKKRVFGMIMVESVMLSLTGGLTGIAFSGIALMLLSRTGIDLSIWAEGLESLGYSAIVYPQISLVDFINIVVLVILTGIVSSIWPARRALKLNPIEALRVE